MNAIQKALGRGRRRLWGSRLLTVTGWALLIGLGAAVLLLGLIDTSLIAALPWWAYPCIAGAAVLAAMLLGLRRRPTDLSVAVLIDERLRLKDQLSTSLWAAKLGDDPFARHVLEQAQRTAESIDTHQALRLRAGGGWKWALPGWAVLALLIVFLPVFDPFGFGQHRQEQLATTQQQEQAREHIMEAASLVKNIEPPKGELSEADPQQAMRELTEMTKRDLSNPDMKREMAAKLSEAQQQLADAQKLADRQVRTMRNQMSQLDTGQSGPADRFADALRRGDYDQAQKELTQMINKIEKGDYSEQEKQALGQQLQNMSQQLQQMARNAANAQQQAQQQVNQQLQQAGVSQQQIQQLQQNGYSQQQMQQALQQAGMSQQQAQQMSQQMSQQTQQGQGQSQSQSQSQCQNLGSSLGALASSIGQNGNQSQGQNQGQQQSPSQAGYGAQQQLSQMVQMQQQLQQMQQAQSQMASALHNLNSQSGQGQGQGQGSGRQQQSQRGGRGGHKAGTGDGGPELGAETNLTGQYQADYEGDIKQREGRAIASWQTYGEVAAGDPTVQYNTAVTQARSEAERAVTDDRVPRRYHGSIKQYFDQLPASPDQVRRAPAAPR